MLLDLAVQKVVAVELATELFLLVAQAILELPDVPLKLLDLVCVTSDLLVLALEVLLFSKNFLG